MKKYINNAAKNTNQKVNEVFLFRQMAGALNTQTSHSVFVKEAHAKMYVKYQLDPKRFAMLSGSKPIIKKVELGDLIILTYDAKVKLLRMSIMQAKYKSIPYRNFLDLYLNLYQWELLNFKPTLVWSNHGIPFNILNSQNLFKSIASYGIFYRDNYNNEIDMLYVIPELLNYKNPNIYKSINGIIENKKRLPKTRDYSFKFNCLQNLNGQLYRTCHRVFGPGEVISTCSINSFKDEILNGRIGVPLSSKKGDNIQMWILGILKKLRNDFNDDHTIQQMIDEILKEYSSGDENYIRNLKTPKHLPPLLFTGVNLPHNEIEIND